MEDRPVTSLNVSLPEPMKKFIETEVKRSGYSTPSEYVRALVRAEQKRLAEDHLERLLMEGLESGESAPMTRKDWQGIRREGLAVIAARKKKARK
jgi:antitoxin ParD1/3/4